MNRFTFAALFILMSLSVFSFAQKKLHPIKWKIVGELPATNGQKKAFGLAGPVVGIHNDMLIIAGGSNFPDSMPWLGGKKKYYDDIYVMKRYGNDSLEIFKSFKLSFPIAYGASCSTPYGIVCAGGENENGISNKVILIEWDNTLEKVIVKDLPSLPVGISNASIASDGSLVYVAGGNSANGVSDLFLKLDLNNAKARWEKLPALPKPVSHAVMVAQSNGHNECIYLIGGRKENFGSTSNLYSSVFQFDLERNVWSEKKSLPYALSAGTGIAWKSHYILLFGGDKGEVFHKTEELIAAINNETDPGKKQILNRQKIQLQSTHPGFSKEVLLYNTITGRWITMGSIPYNVPATTTAVKWNDEVIIPGGEIKAGVRTSQILEGRW